MSEQIAKPKLKPKPQRKRGVGNTAGSRGRQSLYTEELAETIIQKLSDGLSLRRICREKGLKMPHRTTVERWMAENPLFAAKCARAREGDQADFYADKIVDVADRCTTRTAKAARVKISAYQWMAAKLAPKKYGDKTQLEAHVENHTHLEVSGKDGAPPVEMTIKDAALDYRNSLPAPEDVK